MADSNKSGSKAQGGGKQRDSSTEKERMSRSTYDRERSAQQGKQAKQGKGHSEPHAPKR